MASKTDSKGNPIVTPEMIKKAGFTNLRDYLNDKKGLTRRDGKAPERTKEYMAKGKAAEPKPMDAATSARVRRNTVEQAAIRGQDMTSPKPAALTRSVAEARARQGQDMSQGARNMEGYKPRRSGSPLAPRTVEPTKTKAKEPDWASRHSKKGNK